MRFTGSAANSYTGLTRVNSGTLDLAKSDKVISVAGNLAAHQTGTVVWQANDQVADAATLTVNGSGARLDRNGFSDTIGAINMTGGTLDSTSASTVGVIRLAGDITSNISTNTATISGKLDLGTTTHTVSVADDAASPVDDLVISADVSGAGGLVKAGAERRERRQRHPHTGR